MAEVTTLGELLTVTGGSIKTGPFGTALKAAEYADEGAPVISVGEVGPGYVRLHPRTPRVAGHTLDRLPEYILRVGDVVFGRKGAVDRSAWVRPAEDGYFLGSDGIRVRFGDPTTSRFLAFQFQLPATKDWLVQHAAGTTMPSLNQAILERLPIALPSHAEQHAIAEVLGALDDKIAANKETTELLLGLADAQFVKSVAGSNPGPLTFGEVADIGGGGTPRTTVDEYWGGAVQWATPTDVTALGAPYLAGTSRTITDEGLAACSSALHPVGSILMTSRATIGAFAVAKVPTAVNQGFIVVNAKNPAHQWWLFHEMKSRVPEFLSFANGATFLELPRGRFKGLNVRLASGDAMAEFGSVVGPLHEAAAAFVAESETLARTRDALLPLLMSGKVRVMDAEKTVEGVL